MDKQPIMISGLPGKMARLVADAIVASEEFELIKVALTGPEITEQQFGDIQLAPWSRRQEIVDEVKKEHREFLVVDFTHPTAVVDNARFYCHNHLPFVMGTTGGDRQELQRIVSDSDIPAVIAPNMALQVVALQAAIEYMAKHFMGAFTGFELQVTESHQCGKADTSGTAKAMVASFNQLGINFRPEQIVKVRDKAAQLEMGIPETHLHAHGWHTYDLSMPDGSMQFQFVHNVNGRAPYVAGTMLALKFLRYRYFVKKSPGQVYSMVEILRVPSGDFLPD